MVKIQIKDADAGLDVWEKAKIFSSKSILLLILPFVETGVVWRSNDSQQ